MAAQLEALINPQPETQVPQPTISLGGAETQPQPGPQQRRGGGRSNAACAEMPPVVIMEGGYPATSMEKIASCIPTRIPL